ncbi:unnamed protein product [Anisakis simplex]|uniref:Uncharacterized protein n=1 Tax=Anisakis simplex TaxID=6269 RepID=A0A3P6QMC6_ANISI|nr:unnamed protein product [Anisakis simplex]
MYMPRDFYVKPQFLDYLNEYLDEIVDAAVQFGLEIKSTATREAIFKDAVKVARLELKLALASVPSALLRNYEEKSNSYNIEQLKAAYPSIGWEAYLGALLQRENLAILQKHGGDHYAKLFEFLQRVKSDRKRHRSSASVSGAALHCVNLVINFMPMATGLLIHQELLHNYCSTVSWKFLGYTYIKGIDATLRDNTREDVSNMTSRVIEQFLAMISTLPWLTEASLGAAKRKANGLIKNIGWPDWFDFTNTLKIDEYHKNYVQILELDDSWDILNALKYSSQLTENFGSLTKKPDRRSFQGSPAVVNAWYIPERNSITIPFAILNPPFYRHDFPEAYKYGGEGAIVGHELTHGYDDEGVQFGPDGALSSCSWNYCGWMDDHSKVGFIKMAQCVVSQYSEQCCPLKTGNVHCASGERTQGENIADIGGRLAAYKAYRDYVAVDREGIEEDRLPGLEEFTPNQIFWIMLGRVWCKKTYDEGERISLMTDPHPPRVCRVNQVVQDIPEFGKDFNCPYGAPMYPRDTQRCQVWTGQRTICVLVAVALGIASLVLNIIILTKENARQSETTSASDRVPGKPTPVPTISTSPGFKQKPRVNGPKRTTGVFGRSSEQQPFDNGAAAADLLLKGLDLSYDPCKDFYMFTCNKYLQTVQLPKGRGRVGTYAETQIQVNNAIATTLDTAKTLQSKTEQIMQKVFKSCMSWHGQGKATNVYQIMKQLLGGFPMLEPNWDEASLTDEKFWTAIGTLELHYGMASLLQSSYRIRPGNHYNSLHDDSIVHHLQLPLMMARDYYVRPQFLDYLNNYLKDLIDTTKQFKADIKSTVPDEDIVKEATEATRLELQLAIASVPRALLRNYEQQYNPYKVKQLREAYPSIGWDAYFAALLGEPVDPDAEYIIDQPSYFGTLNTILAGKQFSKRTFVNFVAMRFLESNLDFLKDGAKQYAKLYETIQEAKPEPKKVFSSDSWEDKAYGCVRLTEDLMPYGNGYVYIKGVNETLRNDIIKDVEKQTNYVIDEFLKMISTLPWLTPESLKAAKAKAHGLIKNYGWPYWFDFTNPAPVDEYHKNYDNILKMNDWWDILNELQYASQLTENFGNLKKKPDRRNFLQSPAAVNAWYQPGLNSITIPFAELNPPYYRYDFPQAFNYGGEGGTAGHELTHGYDDEGVQFGPQGEMSNCTWDHCGWMDTKSTLGFINMAQCVVSQFSEKCCPLKTGNVHCASGERTQGENIADIGGQLASYKAYRHYIQVDRKGVEEDRLPGLEQFSPNQIFWITYGYSWCMKTTDKYLTRQLMTNPHSPGVCRVNQVMQDIPEFGQDFNCRRGAAMYPPNDERCHVWTGQ